MLDQLRHLLLYPGLVWCLILVVVTTLLRGRRLEQLRGVVTALRNAELPLSWLLALAANGYALTVLPWPTMDGQPRTLNLWLVWSLVEAGSLLTVLSGLTNSSPTPGAGIVHETQRTLLGRVAMWLGLGEALAATAGGFLWARLWAALVVLVALPSALDWPPWGRGVLAPHPKEVPSTQRAAAALLSALRTVVLLALAATLLIGGTPLAWWQVLGAQTALIGGMAVVERGLRGIVVQQRTSAALQWSSRICVPLGAVGLALLWLAV